MGNNTDKFKEPKIVKPKDGINKFEPIDNPWYLEEEKHNDLFETEQLDKTLLIDNQNNIIKNDHSFLKEKKENFDSQKTQSSSMVSDNTFDNNSNIYDQTVLEKTAILKKIVSVNKPMIEEKSEDFYTLSDLTNDFEKSVSNYKRTKFNLTNDNNTTTLVESIVDKVRRMNEEQSVSEKEQLDEFDKWFKSKKQQKILEKIEKKIKRKVK